MQIFDLKRLSFNFRWLTYSHAERLNDIVKKNQHGLYNLFNKHNFYEAKFISIKLGIM